MNWRSLTSLILFGLVACLLLWDWVLFHSGDGGDTVSAQVHQWSASYPILPFTLGVLVGHLFWPQ